MSIPTIPFFFPYIPSAGVLNAWRTWLPGKAGLLPIFGPMRMEKILSFKPKRIVSKPGKSEKTRLPFHFSATISFFWGYSFFEYTQKWEKWSTIFSFFCAVRKKVKKERPIRNAMYGKLDRSIGRGVRWWGKGVRNEGKTMKVGIKMKVSMSRLWRWRCYGGGRKNIRKLEALVSYPNKEELY